MLTIHNYVFPFPLIITRVNYDRVLSEPPMNNAEHGQDARKDHIRVHLTTPSCTTHLLSHDIASILMMSTESMMSQDSTTTMKWFCFTRTVRYERELAKCSSQEGVRDAIKATIYIIRASY